MKDPAFAGFFLLSVNGELLSKKYSGRFGLIPSTGPSRLADEADRSDAPFSQVAHLVLHHRGKVAA